jgi:hypothetical protein
MHEFMTAASKTRMFFAGMLVGALAMAAGNMAAERSGATRTPIESDDCLVAHDGNVTACNAMMRNYARREAREAHDAAVAAQQPAPPAALSKMSDADLMAAYQKALAQECGH